MTVRFLPLLTLLVATALPARTVQARCKTIARPPLFCTEGNPTCDLDGRPDGVCIIALCDTGTSDAPRPTFCAGSVSPTWIYFGGTDRSFVGRAGRCPASKRRVHCRPVQAGSASSGHGTERICTLSIAAPKVTTGPMATRCRIDAFRFEGPSGRISSRLIMRFPDPPFRANGLRGELSMNIEGPLREGVFTFGDPERPAGGVVGNMGGESIPIRLQQSRLQIDQMSPKTTIWTDEIHGTLDVDQNGGPLDPRRVVLHLEF